MIVAFLESIKYTGHLFPLALLRVYLGYYYLHQSLDQYSSLFIRQPTVEDLAHQAIQFQIAPEAYLRILDSLVIPHWQMFSYIFIGIQFLAGISYLIGFCVRPLSLLIALYGFHVLSYVTGPEAVLWKTLIVIHLTLGWLGAGRCFGLDYYFYRRNRGFWW